MQQFLSKEIRARQRGSWGFLALATAVLTAPVHSQTDADGDTGGREVVTFPAPKDTVQGTGTNFQTLLSGQGVPLTLKLKDMNENWRRLSVGGPLELGGLVDTYTSLMGVSGLAGGAYYTRGQTVAVGSETYLIAYQLQPKPADLAAMMRNGPGSEPPAPQKLTAETIVSLSLLNLRTSGSLKGIRPFNLQQEIGGSAKTAEATAEAAVVARNSSSLSNLKQLGLGMMMYAQDYDEVLPPMKDAATMKKSLMPYVKSEQIFISPITKDAYRPNPILSGKKLAHIANPAAMVSIYEASPAPDGTRGVAFVDGHAKRIKEAEWPRLKQASKIP